MLSDKKMAERGRAAGRRPGGGRRGDRKRDAGVSVMKVVDIHNFTCLSRPLCTFINFLLWLR